MPRPYSMRERAQSTSATRARVLDAAVDVLADVGAGNLTMQLVAERADVALRTLYNHFPSKEALVVEAYNRLAAATQTAVRELPADGPARARLEGFLDRFYDVLEQERPGMIAVLGVSGIPEFDARVAAVRTWRRRELTTILRAAEREGTLRLPLKQAVAVAFMWTSFATWSSLADESKLGPVATKQVAMQSLARAVFVDP